MDFSALSKLLVRFAEPGTMLAFLLAAGIVLQWTLQRSWPGRALSVVAVLGLLAIVVLPVDQWLAKPLEDRFQRPQWPNHVDGILVLSAAQQPYISATRATPVQQLGEGTIVAAVELLRRYPQARLVFTGGSASGRGWSASDVAHDIFDQLGVDADRLTYERRSRNTWENILFSHELAKPKPGEVWLLVTNALHMPRAMGVAQRVSWSVLPWPTDYLTPGGAAPVLRRVSLGRNLPTVDAALHEWIGLLVYRLTGRTAALFPSSTRSENE